MALLAPLPRRGAMVWIASIGAAPRLTFALPRRPDLARAAHNVLARGNDFRRMHGLAPLAADPALSAAALAFANYMAKSGRYGHRAVGRAPEERAEAHGYAWCMLAENIAFQYSSIGFATNELAARLVQGWIDSPGHRRNLLDAEAVETGVAIVRAPNDERYYAVQLFGRPRRNGRCPPAPVARRG